MAQESGFRSDVYSPRPWGWPVEQVVKSIVINPGAEIFAIGFFVLLKTVDGCDKRRFITYNKEDACGHGKRASETRTKG